MKSEGISQVGRESFPRNRKKCAPARRKKLVNILQTCIRIKNGDIREKKIVFIRARIKR